MSERGAAVQGTLTVDSAAGLGTQVRGHISLGTAIPSEAAARGQAGS
jgi:hypothetical protein